MTVDYVALAVAFIALVAWAVRVEQRGAEALRRVEALERRADSREAALERKIDALIQEFGELKAQLANVLGRLEGAP